MQAWTRGSETTKIASSKLEGAKRPKMQARSWGSQATENASMKLGRSEATENASTKLMERSDRVAPQG